MRKVRHLFISAAVAVLLVVDFFLPSKALAQAKAQPAPPGQDTASSDQTGMSLVQLLQKIRQPFSKLHPATSRTYIVKAGDCLYWIGQRFGVPWQRIYRDNRAKIGADPALIYAGTHLTITGATQDKPGDIGAGPAETPAEHMNAAPAPAALPVVGLNPMRGVHNLQWERIDEGQDFSGVGPVYAIATGVIEEIWGPDWPGGGYILEHLTSGPHAGSYVYFAEDITPTVHVGEIVNENTQIGYLNGQAELGWATAVPQQTLSAANGSYTYDGKVTPEGVSFHAFLMGLSWHRHHHHHHSSAGASGPIVAGSDNLLTIARWLHEHGYSAAAAAGIVSCIDGESGGNPESVGSGGGGLIGWTPLPGGFVTGRPTADLIHQLQQILVYDNQFGSGTIAHLNNETNPITAAWDYSANFEHPAVTGSDVVDSVATQMFAALGG